MVRIIISLLLFSSISWANFSVQLSSGKDKLKIKTTSGVKEILLDNPDKMNLDVDPLVYYYENYYLVCLQYSDFESGTSFYYAFDGSGKKLWALNLGAFNPSSPFVDGEHVYLSAIGSAWKLDKMTGAVIWKHTDLYSKYQFNGAEEIRREGDFVRLSSNIKVHARTGKIDGGK